MQPEEHILNQTKSERIREISTQACKIISPLAHPESIRKATQLLCLTWAHESSGGMYSRQLGFSYLSTRGAAGEFQMEKMALERCVAKIKNDELLSLRIGIFVFDDPFICKDWIYYLGNPSSCLFSLLVASDKWAACAARIYYQFNKDEIPTSLMDQCSYAKKVWNTPAGKATPEMYRNAFLKLYGKEFV